ncbi:MAG: hypothetical protein H6746_19945 [Deltaproteobacteria bacterium]|nr:hypothetical protein [Deltaproteobacteria bacterium]
MSDSPCPHRPECPGCDWIERPYEAQLAGKRERLVAALGAWPALAGLEVGETLGAEEREDYRTRVKWVVDGARIGLYGRAHAVVDTPECLVVPDAARRLARTLRGRPAEREARLVALDIRCASDGAAVPTLVVEAATPEAARRHAQGLADWLWESADPRPAGVAWSWRRPGAPATLGGAPEGLRGETVVRDRVGLAEARFPPGAFSQAHAPQTARLHALLGAALDTLPERAEAHLVDLYAGTGSIGLALADRVAAVTCVEAFEPAARAAADAARERGLPLTVLARSAEDALGALTSGEDRRPLVIVVDPPRTGLGASVLAILARAPARMVLYVSCDPDTLARDLAILATHGLVAEGATPVDLMPHTSHVETVVTLRPGLPAPLRVVHRAPGLAIVDKPPFLPTTPHPEWPDSVLAQAASALPHPRALHRLDVGTSGLLALGLSDGPAATLEGWTKVYLALVRGSTHQRGTIRTPLREGGRTFEAETRYRKVATVNTHSLLEVELGTGRTHQIRKHLASVGHPVLGDARHGDAATNRFMAARHGLIRPFLHAARLQGPGGEVWESPLWPDLEGVRRSLEAAPVRSRKARGGRGRR